MENQISFEYMGKAYTMSKEEIDAAYWYKQQEFQMEDALVHLNYLVFGYDPDFEDPENATPGELEDMECFQFQYGISYADAKKLLPKIVEKYNDHFDCNNAENDMWRYAIDCILWKYD